LLTGEKIGNRFLMVAALFTMHLTTTAVN
jgi:hypothetical protein